MDQLRVLWFNWRCIKHPLAGGAEVYTHEIARRLVKRGYEVILVTSRVEGLPPKEEIEGYKVIRRGGRLSVYLKASGVYRELKREGLKPDVVVDEINTIPFFTPLYASEPIVVLIHQLCKEGWKYAINRLAKKPGWLFEKLIHRFYARATRQGKVRRVITVSESTKQDLVKLGYPESAISIVYNGLDWNFYKDGAELAKEKEPIVIYLGRITPYKRVEDLLYAWALVKREVPEANLVIAGRPEPRYLAKLRSLVHKLGLSDVEFRLYVSQEEKKRLLAKAMILVYTSVREGWGQTVIEAAACMTPTVAYDVPGLRDSVRHLETGLLVRSGDVRALAQAIIRLLTDRELTKRLAVGAYRWAQKFTWDQTALEFAKVLSECC